MPYGSNPSSSEAVSIPSEEEPSNQYFASPQETLSDDKDMIIKYIEKAEAAVPGLKQKIHENGDIQELLQKKHEDFTADDRAEAYRIIDILWQGAKKVVKADYKNEALKQIRYTLGAHSDLKQKIEGDKDIQRLLKKTPSEFTVGDLNVVMGKLNNLENSVRKLMSLVTSARPGDDSDSKDKEEVELNPFWLQEAKDKAEDLRKNAEHRREFFKGKIETLKSLRALAKTNIVPENARDCSARYGIRVQNTGIYLWVKGYEVDRLLGVGGFGAVWLATPPGKTKPKAIKVQITGNEVAETEEQISKDLRESIIRNNPDAKKYFNLFKKSSASSEGVMVLQSKAGVGDLYAVAKKKAPISRSAEKNITSLLRTSRQALKSVISLHKAGYLHNDIKPENFLKIDNWKSKKAKLQINASWGRFRKLLAKFDLKRQLGTIKPENYKELENFWNYINPSLKAEGGWESKRIKEIQKLFDDTNKSQEDKYNNIVYRLIELSEKKVHKTRIQLADFGLATKLEDGVYGSGGTKGFIPEETYDWYRNNPPQKRKVEKVEKETLQKRDVYALGLTFLCLIFYRKERNQNQIIRNYGHFLQQLPTAMILQPPEDKLSELVNLLKSKDYYPGEKYYPGRLLKYVWIIKCMIEKDVNKRCTEEEALKEIEELRKIKEVDSTPDA